MVRIAVVELTRDRYAVRVENRLAELFWEVKIHHRHDKHIKVRDAASVAELLTGKLSE